MRLPARVARFLARLSAAAALVALPLAALAAQGVDVIRGRITGPDSVPIAGARISATSLGGNVTRTARTSTDGRFTIVFPGAEGDYWVTVTALGFAPRRFQVKRLIDEDVLLADTRLQRAVTELDEVRVIGSRPRVARDAAASPDIGGGDRAALGNAAVAAARQGDLAQLAATVPGVQLVPGRDGDPSGFSVLGLGADANNTQLNGQAFGGLSVPRDAQIASALAFSPYDVARGGFSGAQFQLRTISGSNFVRRTTSSVLDAPPLQFTDATGRALGQRATNLSLGGAAGGPITVDKAFYNASWQLGRRLSDWRTALDTDATGLLAGGLAPDSVARLLGILGTLGVPVRSAETGRYRYGDDASALVSIDVAPPGARFGQSFGVVANGAFSRSRPVTGGLSELPAAGGERSNVTGGLQLRHTAYFDNGVLSETSVNGAYTRAAGDPFTVMPAGQVRIASTLADGTEALRVVSFGGNPFVGVRQSGTSAGVLNTISWFTADSRHRLKLSTELRHDGFSRDQTTNRLGTFAYNSLADLEAGRPAAFTRQLVPQLRRGGQATAAVALGDAWRLSRALQLQLGLRVDGNLLTGLPPRNPAVEQAFGARTDRAPSRVYASPRLGFSWSYGTAPQLAGFEGAVRVPRALVRGGIGVFQGLPPATLLGPALDNTGLPGSTQQVGCFGLAAPAQDWARWLADPASVPTQCAAGLPGGGFGTLSPNVTFFGPDWRAPRSLRGNLQWSGPVLRNRFLATIDATLSRTANQASWVDLNFDPRTGFTLADEGGRAVYVPVASVDPGTGAIAPQASRVDPRFTLVTQNLSDTRSTTRQLQVTLAPVAFSSRLQWFAAYTLARNTETFRGFASAAGDPRALQRSPGLFDVGHQLTYQLRYNLLDAVRLAWTGIVRSGVPYTPVVGGDVNGDGLANDRAFVADPAVTADPALAAGMRALLDGARGGARDCLARTLGTVAPRNACRGPWTQTAFVEVSFNPLKVGLPQRATVSFQVGNPLGALDQLLHGGALRGWGQPALPDPVLLYPRGFDPVARRYRYEVNQRFGDTRPAVSTVRLPVTITATVRIDLGPSRERQLLVQQLDRGRRTEGQKAGEFLLQQQYGTTGPVPNPLAQLLRQVDTLQLTPAQADSIATLNRWYTIRLARLWTPVVRDLAQLPDDYDRDRAYGRYRDARERSIDLLREIAPGVRGLLTAAQRRRLPPIVASLLDPRYLKQIRSATVGGGMFDSFGGAGGIGGMIPAGGGAVFLR